MASRFLILFLTHWLLLITGTIALTTTSVLAQENESSIDDRQVIPPELERRKIKEADIDTENFEVGAYAGVLSVDDFGSHLVYGARGAYHVTEDFFLEGSYATSDTHKTSFERLSGTAELLTNSERKFTYYNLSLGYNIFPGEAFLGSKYAFNTSLYVIAGIGSTEFAGDNLFTINFGAGYRFLITDWAGVRIGFRDHVFKSDLLGSRRTNHNLEAHAGLTFFF